MDVRSIVGQVSQLVSLPEVWVRVNELLNDANSTAGQLGEVVGLDPALTARLLKMVNSSYYGLRSRVERVSQAIAVVGTDDLRSLVLATSAVETFRKVPTDLVDMTTFWHHSVCCALAARRLGELRGEIGRERLFVAGLLHDVGQIVLYGEVPEVAAQALAGAVAGGRPLHEVEREVMGFDHAEVGAALLAAWNLPESLVEAVGCHHKPGRAHSFPLEAAVVHLANGVASALEPARKGPRMPWGAPLAVEEGAWATAGLDPAVAEAVGQDVAAAAFEVLEVIAPGASVIC